MLGITALVLTILVFTSFFFTTIDKFLHSKCGFNCGYIVEKKKVFNPIDSVLVTASHLFPLDYLLFYFLASYIYISVLYGI